MHVGSDRAASSHLGTIILSVAGTVIALLVLGVALRVVLPAASGRHDARAKERARRDMLALFQSLSSYAEESNDGAFPASLTNLVGAGAVDEQRLGELESRYWYLPQVANRGRDFVSPIIIEKEDHYSRGRGGYVFFSGGNVRWYGGSEYDEMVRRFVGSSGRDEGHQESDGR